tara:strand:+ start:553 stop:792 length:240 start_codon:yes stop_codon:yes gene_type:complete
LSPWLRDDKPLIDFDGLQPDDASHPETPRAFMNDEEEAAYRAYIRAWYHLNHGDDVRRDVADAGFEEGGTGDDDDDIYG